MAEQSLSTQSDNWLKQRIDMNRSARFGLEEATPAQLNVVYVLCKRWHLDPVTDLTLYQGRPWITVEGHMRRMREHPDFRGVERRALNQDEKVLGGWNADDIVWETSIKTAHWGVITDWGKVTRAEVDDALASSKRSGKRSAPLGMHPVEIAQKRSLARANRLAFGMDAPDEEQIEQEVAEEMARRSDPVSVRENAASYDRIYAEPELPAPAMRDFAEAPIAEAEEEAESVEEPPSPPAPSDPWMENRRLYFEAVQAGLRPKTLRNNAPTDVVEAYNQQLQGEIAARRLAS